MNSLVILSLCLGLAIAEPILLPHPNPHPRADPYSHSKLGLRLNSTDRIIGGVDATAGQAPHQISLRRTSHSCGGSIISTTVIVTAAHCVDGASVGSLSVRYNSLQHASGGTIVSLAKYVRHASYDSWTIDFDIAVLITATPLTLGGQLAGTISLPAQGSDPADGATCEITGWGTTSESGSLPPNLKIVETKIISRAACNQAYASYGYEITPQMICAGEGAAGGKDACQGDSGGPLVVNGVLEGAVSWGVGCARPNVPGVYARVGSFVTWINDNSQ